MIALVLLLILALIVFMTTGGQSDWKVYGTMGCGWTVKQLDNMKSNGVSHTFINCENGACPGMEAFPTLVHKNGERHVGFKDMGPASIRPPPSAGAEGGWTVYGTMGCGWTRKQLEYMKNNNIPHTFIDCEKGGCPAAMKAFPTLVHPNGEEIVGFKEV